MLHPGIGCAFASGDTSKSQVRFDLDTSDINWEKLWRHGKIKCPPQRFAAPSGFVGDGRQNLKGSLKLRWIKSGATILCPQRVSGFRSLESREEGFSESYETKQGNLKNSYSREMSDQASSRAFSRPKLQVLHPGIGCAFASGDTSPRCALTLIPAVSSGRNCGGTERSSTRLNDLQHRVDLWVTGGKI